ncbi:MAG: CoA transferase [Alphaproteobacteria bacterium]|jgi:crotonobetainyl-CoA:carnitine CoA-transferase CaiB-like acyl-CoA transferase
MPGPLDGIKVIDLTSMVSGPLTTMILADQGADVIKIENPRGGDHTRGVSTRHGGFSASFLNNNRNKRSVALNLKDPRGVAVLMKLVTDADVFVQNFRPGVVERMGVGEDAIRAVAPDIIYVSISGFGERGPYAAKPVYDPLVQALSGLTTIQAGSDDERPRLVRTIVPDKLTGFAGSQAITAALLARERGAGGQHIRLSMLDAVVSFLWASDMSGQTFVDTEVDQQRAQSFIDLIYDTKDGHISVAVQSDKEWAGLSRALGRPDYLEDERFKTVELRQYNLNDRLTVTQEGLRGLTCDECLARLEAEDVPCAPVLRRRDVASHPQLVASETVVETDHPYAGRVRQARPAARFSETAPEHRFGGPRLGEHSRDVLAASGFAAADIDALVADAVVATDEAG